MQAALELFSKNGYAGTRTREIAQRAEVTEVTLFRHFNSKEALFEETVLYFLPCPDFETLIAKASEMEYREALCMIARSFFDGLKAHTGLINLMYMENRRYFDLLQRVYTALIKNLANLLAVYFVEMQNRNLIRKLDPAVMATMFLGIFLSLYDEAFFYAHEESSNVSGTIDAMVGIFMHGTCAPENALCKGEI